MGTGKCLDQPESSYEKNLIWILKKSCLNWIKVGVWAWRCLNFKKIIQRAVYDRVLLQAGYWWDDEIRTFRSSWRIKVYQARKKREFTARGVITVKIIFFHDHISINIGKMVVTVVYWECVLVHISFVTDVLAGWHYTLVKAQAQPLLDNNFLISSLIVCFSIFCCFLWDLMADLFSGDCICPTSTEQFHLQIHWAALSLKGALWSFWTLVELRSNIYYRALLVFSKLYIALYRQCTV